MAESSPSIDTQPEPAENAPDGGGAAASPSGRRRDQTGRDMMLSLAVLLIPILVIGALLRACGSSDPTVVDPTPAIDEARTAALFPVVVPHDLGDGWRVVQAGFARTNDGAGTLRLGYLAPGGGEVLVVVSNEESGALLERELSDDVRPQGEVTVSGTAWASSVVRGEERALVRSETVRSSDRETVRTIIIVGHAGIEQLTTLAAALR